MGGEPSSACGKVSVKGDWISGGSLGERKPFQRERSIEAVRRLMLESLGAKQKAASLG